jgi:dihydrofolate reductase
MGKIRAAEFVTLDGVMEAPNQWNIPYVNDEMAKDTRDDLVASDALLYGRTTFEVMAAAWPSRTDELGIAERFNNLPKFVVSSTLKKTEWNRSAILSGDPLNEVRALKARFEKPILIWGSCRLVQTLMDHDLIDEYRIYIHPLVLGKGKRLFRDGVARRKFRVTDNRAFATGVVAVTYDATKS